MNIQQLRAQIATLQDATMDENRNFRSAYDEGKFDALTAVDALLDSLQEVPMVDTQSTVVLYGLTGSVGNTKEEPVSKKLSNVQRTGKDWKVPISEDLEYASENYACRFSSSKYGHDKVKDAFITGVNWKKEQMMSKAIDVEVKIDAGGYPYIPQIELWDYDKDEPLAEEGDKVKVIVIKED